MYKYEFNDYFQRNESIKRAEYYYALREYKQSLIEWISAIYGQRVSISEVIKEADCLLLEIHARPPFNDERRCAGLKYFYDTYIR